MLTKLPVPYDLYVADPKKALVGAFSVITNLRMELFEALTHPLAVTILSSLYLITSHGMTALSSRTWRGSTWRGSMRCWGWRPCWRAAAGAGSPWRGCARTRQPSPGRQPAARLHQIKHYKDKGKEVKISTILQLHGHSKLFVVTQII